MLTYLFIQDPNRLKQGDWVDPALNMIDPTGTNMRFVVQGHVFRGKFSQTMMPANVDGVPACYYGDFRIFESLNLEHIQSACVVGPYQFIAAMNEERIYRRFYIKWLRDKFCCYWLLVDNSDVRKIIDEVVPRVPKVIAVTQVKKSVGSYIGGNLSRLTLLNLWCYHNPMMVSETAKLINGLICVLDWFAFVESRE